MEGNTEFSDRFHAMTVKELRQSMRRANFVYPFLVIQLLAVAAMAMEFANNSVYRSLSPAILNLDMLLESGPFWYVAFLVCGVIMPLGGITLMNQELEEGNHELLSIASLNRWAVVRGKFFVLWAVSVLVLISLLPYVVVRYFIGGVEMWQELMCTLTVIAFSAIMCAGVLAAAGYRSIPGRIAVLLSYLVSITVCGSMVVGLGAMAWRDQPLKVILLLNANALVLIFSYCMLGLAISRSRLRTSLRIYEVNPSRQLLVLLFFTPFISGIIAAISCGHFGVVGLLLVILMCNNVDPTPKAQKKLGR